MGNVCGAKNTFNGTEYDLRGAKKLYWLDPFEVQHFSAHSLLNIVLFLFLFMLVSVCLSVCAVQDSVKLCIFMCQGEGGVHF